MESMEFRSIPTLNGKRVNPTPSIPWNRVDSMEFYCSMKRLESIENPWIPNGIPS
jgi:hypothetical protein